MRGLAAGGGLLLSELRLHYFIPKIIIIKAFLGLLDKLVFGGKINYVLQIYSNTPH